MNNMDIYNKVKVVPKTAQKEIKAGRLRGMTDINPMWRIQVLTETFGPCGIGWYYEVIKQWIEEGSEGQKLAFININLFVKIDDEWSKPIFGTGGNSFIAKETKGLYTSDECFKMALTDALSVSCKALGIGADVYWQGGRTKYSGSENNNTTSKDTFINQEQLQKLVDLGKTKDIKRVKEVLKYFGVVEAKYIPMQKYQLIYNEIEKL